MLEDFTGSSESMLKDLLIRTLVDQSQKEVLRLRMETKLKEIEVKLDKIQTRLEDLSYATSMAFVCLGILMLIRVLAVLFK